MTIFNQFLSFIQGLLGFEFVIYFGVFFLILGLILLIMRLCARW